MRYIYKEIQKPNVNLYPLSDWHVGSKQCNMEFIKTVCNRIANDPDALWIYMGDGGECVTKTSKGNLFEQTYSPGDQLRIVSELLKPIATKGLCGIRGNHGNRIDKDTGVGWDEMLCNRVGIPYAGVACLASVKLGVPEGEFSIYMHHGSTGAVTPSGKINASRKPGEFVLADIILTGHHHGCGEVWPSKVIATVDNKNKRIKWVTSRMFGCGSAYDGRSGYGEEKLYPPMVPEHLMLAVRAIRETYKGRKYTHIDIQPELLCINPNFSSDHEEAKWRGEDG